MQVRELSMRYDDQCISGSTSSARDAALQQVQPPFKFNLTEYFLNNSHLLFWETSHFAGQDDVAHC